MGRRNMTWITFFLILTFSGVLQIIAELNNKNSKCVCGIANESVPRIIGGRNSAPHDYPWMAHISANEVFYCGGALINDRYVLTAAHCVNGLPKANYTVALGVYDQAKLHSDSEVQFYDVKDIKVHKEYRSLKYNDEKDIALIKLEKTVKFTPNIQPICLPERSQNYTGITAIILGWGKLAEGGKAPTILNVAEVTIITQETCKKVEFIGKYLTDDMMCGLGVSTDACQGDSGGPMVLPNKKGYYEEIGVISWGIGCGRPGVPGVYLRTDYYLDWVLENTKDGVYCSKTM